MASAALRSSMLRRALVLGLLVLATLGLPAQASAPVVIGQTSPAGGKAFFDPILTWSAFYSEPGTTDCVQPSYRACDVQGPGQAARFVRVVIEGHGRIDFDLADEATHTDLLTRSCASTGAWAQCVFVVDPRTITSPAFHLQAYATEGTTGTAIHLYLESGASIMGQML